MQSISKVLAAILSIGKSPSLRTESHWHLPVAFCLSIDVLFRKGMHENEIDNGRC